MNNIITLTAVGCLASASVLVGCDTGPTAQPTDGGAGDATDQGTDAGAGSGRGPSTPSPGGGTAQAGTAADEGEASPSTTSGAATLGTSESGGASATDAAAGETSGAAADYDAVYASVTSVETAGGDGMYTFSVGVFSPDTGCDQYANWWEVVSEEGELLHRRILTHSHVAPEWPQPFVRASLAPIQVPSDQTVIVRAHMNTSSFGYRGYRGSVDAGFEPFETAPDFAAELDPVPPQPGECPF